MKKNRFTAFLDRIFAKIISRAQKHFPEKAVKLMSHFLSAEFVLFIIIGAFNTLSTALFATVMDFIPVFKTEFCQSLGISFIIGYMLSMTVSFFLNTCVTFGEKPTLKKALRFPLSYIPNFIVQLICVRLFKLFRAPNTAAYLTAAVIGLPVTFLTMKFIVYRKKND